MTHNETVEATQGKKAELNKKIVYFFSLKMFRYTLIKMLKAPSTWVMFVLTLVVGIIMVLSLALGIRDVASGGYIDAAKSLFTIY